ncbi:MAG: HAD-IC family P-type ATPase, partial [Chthoniobacterales bacterium]|nr:HAD-IC family P-type ATPase [Chthoniobacterales bacterium]
MSQNPKVCLYSEIVRLLAEEPRLEAVALRGNRKEISIATLGSEDASRLHRRVEQIVASHPPLICPLTSNGTCAGCGANPLDSAPPGAKIVIKKIFNDILIEKSTCTTAISFWHWVSLRWPKYVPREHSLTDVDENEWKPLALQALGCLLFGLAGWFLESLHFPPLIPLLLYILSYACGAWEAAIEAWQKIRSAKLDIHFLMLSVAIGAAVIGAWREGALLLFLFSASGAMEHYAMGRTRREIRSLLDGSPKTARIITPNNTERTLPIDQITTGMRVRVLSGELIPVDMKVIKGESACDESNLTGESRPVPKTPGDTALAGTMNLWGLLEGIVLRPASQSALQKIINLIQRAQELKAPSQRFTDKFGTGYTWAILSICTIMFFVWWLGFGLPPLSMNRDTPSALYRAMTLLVVASPCALVLSVPSSILC